MIGSGDLAVVRGAFFMLLVPPGAAAPVADTSKYVEVWRRQADRSWRLAWDIANSDRPLEAPFPLAAGK